MFLMQTWFGNSHTNELEPLCVRNFDNVIERLGAICLRVSNVEVGVDFEGVLLESNRIPSKYL